MRSLITCAVLIRILFHLVCVFMWGQVHVHMCACAGLRSTSGVCHQVLSISLLSKKCLTVLELTAWPADPGICLSLPPQGRFTSAQHCTLVFTVGSENGTSFLMVVHQELHQMSLLSDPLEIYVKVKALFIITRIIKI